MKKSLLPIAALALGILMFTLTGTVSQVAAQGGIHYDGASQMYWAFVKNTAEPFTKETGIPVVAEDRKTQDAVPSLVSGRCNVGGLARKMKLAEKAQNQNLTETLIAHDHIAVFVPSNSKVEKLSKEQLKKVFAGEITDWKDIGDEPGPIQIVMAQTKTACTANFQEQVMGQTPFAQSSTITETAGAVLEQAKGKRAISFISFGALANSPDFKTVKVDGKSPGESGYSIAQEMYLATIGPPAGDVKKYVDFFLTGSGKEFIKKAGLMPAQ